MNNYKADRKRMRRSSSTGNMDQTKGHVESLNIDKITQILDEISLFRQDQNEVKESLENRIDLLSKELPIQINENIESKLNVFRTDLNSMRHDLNATLQNFDKRIVAVERKVIDLCQHQPNPLKDCERCVIASGIHYEQGENLMDKVGRLLFDLGNEIVQNTTIVATERLKSRNPDKPSLVKIAFLSLEQKIEVLRAKQKLTNSQEFNKVRIWSSKTHNERLLEINCKTLLNLIPGGNNYRLAANGRMVPRDNRLQTPVTVTSKPSVPPMNSVNWPPLGQNQMTASQPAARNQPENTAMITSQQKVSNRLSTRPHAPVQTTGALYVPPQGEHRANIICSPNNGNQRMTCPQMQQSHYYQISSSRLPEPSQRQLTQFYNQPQHSSPTLSSPVGPTQSVPHSNTVQMIPTMGLP